MKITELFRKVLIPYRYLFVRENLDLCFTKEFSVHFLVNFFPSIQSFIQVIYCLYFNFSILLFEVGRNFRRTFSKLI